jgi:hypothetical protein
MNRRAGSLAVNERIGLPARHQRVPQEASVLSGFGDNCPFAKYLENHMPY